MEINIHKQNGFTLLEIIIALAILGAIIVGSMTLAMSQATNKRIAIATTQSLQQVLSIHNILALRSLKVINVASVGTSDPYFIMNPVYDPSLPVSNFYKRNRYNWPEDAEHFLSRECGNSASLENELGLPASEQVANNSIPCLEPNDFLTLDYISIPREGGALLPSEEISYLLRLNGGPGVNFIALRNAIEQTLANEGLSSDNVNILTDGGAMLGALSELHKIDANDLHQTLLIEVPLAFNNGYLRSDGSIQVENNPTMGLCWDTSNLDHANTQNICLSAVLTGDGNTMADELRFKNDDGTVANVTLNDTLKPVFTRVIFNGLAENVTKRSCPDGYQIVERPEVTLVEIFPEGIQEPITGVAVTVEDGGDNWILSSQINTFHLETDTGVEIHNSGVTALLSESCTAI